LSLGSQAPVIDVEEAQTLVEESLSGSTLIEYEAAEEVAEEPQSKRLKITSEAVDLLEKKRFLSHPLKTCRGIRRLLRRLVKESG